MSDLSRRGGIPIDPLLQLAMGELVYISSVVWTGGNADPIAPEDPMRVALYVWSSTIQPAFALAPAPGPVLSVTGAYAPCIPIVIHCRDYPGMVQSAWVGSGMLGNLVQVWSYRLN